MKGPLGILIFILVSVQAAQKNIRPYSPLKDVLKNPDWVSLVEKSSRARLVKANDPVTANDAECSVPYSCVDCSTSRVCKPTTDGLTPVRTTKCEDQFPYCDSKTGTCVAEVTDNCGEEDPDFICMGVQKYPDNSCTVFHVCNEQYVPHKFECRVTGEKYNPLTGSCEPKAECGEFECQGFQGTKVPHSKYPGYYAYCQEKGSLLVVDSCKGDYQLNATSQKCEPVCKANGLVQDLEDCHSYYQCTNIFISKGMSFMNKEKKTCPANEGFNPQTFQCVPIAQLPSDIDCPAKVNS